MGAREGIRDKVSIVGVGCCQFGENWDKSPSDMIVDAAYEAYADAGIDEPAASRSRPSFTGSALLQRRVPTSAATRSSSSTSP